jgi:hypothetical protein
LGRCHAPIRSRRRSSGGGRRQNLFEPDQPVDEHSEGQPAASPRTNRIGRTTPPNPHDDDTDSTLRLRLYGAVMAAARPCKHRMIRFSSEMNDVGTVLAIYAAVVSTVSAAVAWRSWRRAPASLVEFRELWIGFGRGKPPSSIAEELEIEPGSDAKEMPLSCIAANRSPYAVEVVEAFVKCPEGDFICEGKSRYLASRNRWGASEEFQELLLRPVGGEFPLTILPGQGRMLYARIWEGEFPSGRILTFVGRTSAGLTFSEEYVVPSGPTLPPDLSHVSYPQQFQDQRPDRSEAG